MKTRQALGTLVMATVLGATFGCTSAQEINDYGEPEDSGPLLVAEPSDEVAYPSADLSGRLTRVKDCVALDGLPVLWPSGTTWNQESQEVVMPDGERVSIGTDIRGAGGLVATSVATNYGGTVLQEAVNECAADLGVTRMALLSGVQSQ